MNSSSPDVLYEPDHRVPLVDLQLYVKTGAALDPEHLPGLGRLSSYLVRSGTESLSRVEVPAMWDSLGARLSTATSLSYRYFHLTSLRDHFGSGVRLLSSLLSAPALRKEDLAFYQRDLQQARLASREDPQALAARALSIGVFGTHTYARGTQGSELGLARVTVDDIRDHLRQHLVRSNLVIGCSGDVGQDEAEALVQEQFSWVPDGSVRDDTPSVEAPKRTAVVIEMPEQAQAQLYVGTTGAIAGELDFDPWQVSTIAFGGVFSSRLTQQIRERHGYSYEANARLYMARQRNLWRTFSFPSKDNLGDCIRVQLEMIAALREFGLGAEELRDTKRYMENSQHFERETACKRLDPRLDEALYGLPRGWYDAEQSRIQAISNDQIKVVLQRRLPDSQLCVGVAGPPGIAKIVEDAFAPAHMMVLTPEAVAS